MSIILSTGHDLMRFIETWCVHCIHGDLYDKNTNAFNCPVMVAFLEDLPLSGDWPCGREQAAELMDFTAELFFIRSKHCRMFVKAEAKQRA